MVFAELGADVTTIHDEPDGVNINDRCGSQHTEDLRARVVELGADIGLAFDGDGDRLIAIDEKGQEITGDHIMVICAKRLKDQGKLRNNLVVSTVMSNFGFGLALKALDIDYTATRVGDRYVLETMQQRDAVIGGEASGHTIFLDRHTTGDGIVTALQLLAALRDAGKPLSEMAKLMQLFPQVIINVDVPCKPPFEELPELQAAVKAAEAELGDKGRVLVRYSGTQSMCRVMVEGPTEETTQRLARRLADAARKSIC
jgi:phosphoglucosamine mutase